MYNLLCTRVSVRTVNSILLYILHTYTLVRPNITVSIQRFNSGPLGVVLTFSRIATEYLFNDFKYIQAYVVNVVMQLVH